LAPEKGEKHPNAGRPKGAKNVVPRELKDAILRAAESRHAKGNRNRVKWIIHMRNRIDCEVTGCSNHKGQHRMTGYEACDRATDDSMC